MATRYRKQFGLIFSHHRSSAFFMQLFYRSSSALTSNRTLLATATPTISKNSQINRAASKKIESKHAAGEKMFETQRNNHHKHNTTARQFSLTGTTCIGTFSPSNWYRPKKNILTGTGSIGAFLPSKPVPTRGLQYGTQSVPIP